MSVELRPLGVKCNLGCGYCYQNPQRDANNVGREYDIDAMKQAVEAEGGPFTLFGGEPLLVPLDDLEELFRWGHEKYGGSAIQTNGSLVNDRHLELFAKYNVDVGISMDGPEALNEVRWAGSHAATRRATSRSLDAVEKLCEAGRPPSLIVTLHQGNANERDLPALLRWIEQLADTGIRQMRVHLLEVEGPDVAAALALSAAENIAALTALAELEERINLQFDVFDELESLLLGDDENVTCVWRACDPDTTAAVRGVEGFGQRSNCGRTNKDGVDFVKSDAPAYLRVLALYHTPRQLGGCAGCRFFVACKGQCPGTGIDGDWRNRTVHCEEWEALFRRAEEHLLEQGEFPISAQPNRVHLEAEMLAAWARGDNPSIAATIDLMQSAEGDADVVS